MAERQAAWKAWKDTVNPSLGQWQAREGFFAGYDAGRDEAVTLFRRLVSENKEDPDGEKMVCEIEAYLGGTFQDGA